MQKVGPPWGLAVGGRVQNDTIIEAVMQSEARGPEWHATLKAFLGGKEGDE